MSNIWKKSRKSFRNSGEISEGFSKEIHREVSEEIVRLKFRSNPNKIF